MGLFRCIGHFNGLPWFLAPLCEVPIVTATWVCPIRSDTFVEKPAPKLSIEAPTFVPGATQWAVNANASKVSERPHESDCLSEKSTDGGLSSDEASCCSDTEFEVELV